MDVPEGYCEIEDGDGRAVVRADLARVPVAFWWQPGEPLAGARGRGGVRVLERDGIRAVARHYRRGGALRRLNKRFLDGTRARRELATLVALRQRGVPAVEPLAAVCRRHGLFYRMRLATVQVEAARPLPSFVAEHPERAREAVCAAGRAVRQAFEAGLDHPDLHPDNLVVSVVDDEVRVLLLDLDRAALRADLAPSDRDRMLLRMARYLERHAGALPVVARTIDQLRFLAGMGLDRAARRAELTRLRPMYERMVARHRVMWGRK